MALRTLLPTVQPNCCSPCRSAALRACPSGSSAGKFAMRRMRSPCCARAATGHATAAPPSSVMKSRQPLAPFFVLPLLPRKACEIVSGACEAGQLKGLIREAPWRGVHESLVGVRHEGAPSLDGGNATGLSAPDAWSVAPQRIILETVRTPRQRNEL
jgi:hypothetical protein